MSEQKSSPAPLDRRFKHNYYYVVCWHVRCRPFTHVKPSNVQSTYDVWTGLKTGLDTRPQIRWF